MASTEMTVTVGSISWRVTETSNRKKAENGIFSTSADRMVANMHEVPEAASQFMLKTAA